MEFKVRQATMDDKEQMLELYNSYVAQFVGSASRTLKSYARLLRRKANVHYVASDSQNRSVG